MIDLRDLDIRTINGTLGEAQHPGRMSLAAYHKQALALLLLMQKPRQQGEYVGPAVAKVAADG